MQDYAFCMQFQPWSPDRVCGKKVCVENTTLMDIDPQVFFVLRVQD
jgi:hypothetical protein